MIKYTWHSLYNIVNNFAQWLNEVYPDESVTDVFGADADEVKSWLTQQLLIARRRESAGNSLFDVFNNIQENIIRGQVPKRAANGKVRNSREVKSVNEDQRLNKALWTLSAEMARLVA